MQLPADGTGRLQLGRGGSVTATPAGDVLLSPRFARARADAAPRRIPSIEGLSKHSYGARGAV